MSLCARDRSPAVGCKTAMRCMRTAEHQLLLMMPALRLRKVSVTTSYSLASTPYGLGIWPSLGEEDAVDHDELVVLRARATLSHRACLCALGQCMRMDSTSMQAGRCWALQTCNPARCCQQGLQCLS